MYINTFTITCLFVCLQSVPENVAIDHISLLATDKGLAAMSWSLPREIVRREVLIDLLVKIEIHLRG